MPWFIFLFVLAMLANTFLSLPAMLTGSMVWLAHKGLTLTLFFIGAGLSRGVLRRVGMRSLTHAVLLWLVIGVSSLAYVWFFC